MIRLEKKFRALVRTNNEWAGSRRVGGGKNETSQTCALYPKVSGLAAWSENCKWYSFLPLGAVISLFCESV
jgi:hypothetical protein